MKLPEALLEAVLAQPDDDAPRLVCADWLQSRGDPRGELIAIQCKREQGEHEEGVSEELVARERALLAEHGDAWLAELGLPADDGGGAWGSSTSSLPPELEPVRNAIQGCTFRRGFVEDAAIAADVLCGLDPRLVDRTPLRSLLIRAPATAEPPDPVALIRSLEGNTLTVLYFEDWASLEMLSDAELRGLLASFRSPRLDELSLRGTSIGQRGAGFLASPPVAPSLRALRLGDEQLQNEGAAVLAAAFGETLMTLRLNACGLRPPCPEALSSCGALRRLGLAGNALGPDGGAWLARTGFVPELWSLDLRSTELDPSGLRAICERATRLKSLALAGNPLGDAGAIFLAAWPGLAQVRELDLEATGIGDEGLAALASSEHLKAEQMRRLRVAGNAFGDAARDALRRRFGSRSRALG